MCKLYSMTSARQGVLNLFRLSDNRCAQVAPLPAIFPGRTAPVVRLTGDGERELVPMTWGFVLPRDGYPTCAAPT